jgi:hypothetical protein
MASRCGKDTKSTKLKNHDVKLCYFGGSGGFIVLHLMLLSKNFFCQFCDPEQTIEQIIDKQWKISEPRLWKANEYWPDNIKTQNAQTDLRKIYFFCSPNIDEVNRFDGKIFFLYLDAYAHIKMVEYKHANYFYNESTSLFDNYVAYYRAKLQGWQEHYKNIKDPSWPRCTGPSGFKTLPHHIQKELLDNPYTSANLNIQKYIPLDNDNRNKKIELLHSKKVTAANGIEVMPEVGNFLCYADLALCLTDIINDLDILNQISKSTINQDQIALRNRWTSLHPSSLLNSIGIKTY